MIVVELEPGHGKTNRRLDMKNGYSRLSLIAWVIALAILGRAAQAQDKDQSTAPAPIAGIRGEFLRQLDGMQSKLVELAGAMPQAKYTWRPAKGERSVAEVYLHVAAA